MSKLTKYSAVTNLLMFLWLIMTFYEGSYGMGSNLLLIKTIVFIMITVSMALGFLLLVWRGSAILLKIQAPITSLLCIAWTIIIYVSSIDFEYYEWMSISYLVDGLGRVGITVLLTVLVYTGKLFMKETDKPEMQRTSLAYALFPIGVLFLVNSLSIINSSAFYYMLQLGNLYHYMGMAFYPTVTFISALLLTAAAFNYCRIRSRALNLIIAVLAFVFAAGDLIVELVPLLISML